MALKLNKNFNGFDYPEIYAAITAIGWDKHKPEKMRVSVTFYPNEDVRHSTQFFVGHISYFFDLLPGATIADAYNALKERPEYAEAIDLI